VLPSRLILFDLTFSLVPGPLLLSKAKVLIPVYTLHGSVDAEKLSDSPMLLSVALKLLSNLLCVSLPLIL
jgi:hypothetical protein